MKDAEDRGSKIEDRRFPRLYEPAEESELHGWLGLLAKIEFAVLLCLLAAYGLLTFVLLTLD